MAPVVGRSSAEFFLKVSHEMADIVESDLNHHLLDIQCGGLQQLFGFL